MAAEPVDPRRVRSRPPGGPRRVAGTRAVGAGRGSGPASGAASARPGPDRGRAASAIGPTRDRLDRQRTGRIGGVRGRGRRQHGPARGRTDRPLDAPPRGPRKRNKATLGSTSYDGATAPFEPDWGGASWYGTTSGTYWTLNPKEYADPRKHGPEYQARARRAAEAGPPGSARTPDRRRSADGRRTGRGRPDDPARRADRRSRPRPDPHDELVVGVDDRRGDRPGARRRTAAAAADRVTPAPGRPPDREPVDRRRRRRTSGAPWPTSVAPSPTDLRRLARPRRSGPSSAGCRSRSAIGWLIGEITGCGRFAATCDGTAGPIVLVAPGRALLGLLLAVPDRRVDRGDGAPSRCSAPRSSAALRPVGHRRTPPTATRAGRRSGAVLRRRVAGRDRASRSPTRARAPRSADASRILRPCLPVATTSATCRAPPRSTCWPCASWSVGRRGPGHRRPGRPPPRGHHPGRQRDVPAPRRGRARRPRRGPRPAPDARPVGPPRTASSAATRCSSGC